MGGKERLYEKVKFVEGENFVTIEEAHRLNADEMMNLADCLVEDERIQEAEHLTILLNDSFPLEVAKHLERLQFKLHDENVFVRCDLSHLNEPKNRFQLRSLHEVSTEQFKQVWEKVMEGSLNAASYLNMDEQMKSVEKELGSTYKDTCNIAYEEGRVIGVVMPHIEPGTKEEGRIFYFGLVPEARGKGKSADLYLQGLHLLKECFGAAYSVGATSVKNVPMQKVFEKHNCQVTDQVKVYKRWNGGI
ncbi:GNAT family N-acetyltransferase [Halobacillus sp. BBL2006]|uniref:GNAT family N-acetyltransferase n=1 Tax=Halobacillus sp. BBL2006 TaxID=1543706 RepID=UPI00068D5718|nr:GNAT family N-acetyltransferase [Halobacillus sp. BBL2006]